MAKDSKSQQKRKTTVHALPLRKRNYQILASAVVVILLGYVALAQSPWDGFIPLVVAPILLLLGYCVLVPLGILYREKGERQTSGEANGMQPES